MITLIWASDEAGGIGFRDELPWPKIKEDFRRFKAATLDHVIVMGRKTYVSLGSKALPKRTNVVVTHSLEFHCHDATVVSNLNNLIDTASVNPDVETFIIGGAEIYTQTIDRAHRILLTRVMGTYEADTFFNPDLTGWERTAEEKWFEEDKHVCTFEEYCRKAI